MSQTLSVSNRFPTIRVSYRLNPLKVHARSLWYGNVNSLMPVDTDSLRRNESLHECVMTQKFLHACFIPFEKTFSTFRQCCQIPTFFQISLFVLFSKLVTDKPTKVGVVLFVIYCLKVFLSSWMYFSITGLKLQLEYLFLTNFLAFRNLFSLEWSLNFM